MKLRTIIAIVLAMTVLAVPAMGAEDPEAEQPIKPADQHWSEENQKLVALIKKKKIQEGMEKAESIMAYLKEKNLLESYQAATTYNNLGTIYLSLGAYGKSQVYLLKALKLRAEIFGNNSLEVATVFINMSQLYKMQAQRIINAHQGKKAAKTGEKPD